MNSKKTLLIAKNGSNLTLNVLTMSAKEKKVSTNKTMLRLFTSRSRNQLLENEATRSS